MTKAEGKPHLLIQIEQSQQPILSPRLLSPSSPCCRHLYLQSLKHCYLFNACKPKFMDAVMAACRADMFMPDVQVRSQKRKAPWVTEGDSG